MAIEETSHYAIQAVSRAILREDFTAELGRIEYSITKLIGYHLIRAVIPFESGERSVFVLLTFDVESNPIEVSETKVNPYLRSHSSNR